MTPYMTATDRKALEDYTRDIARRIRMQDWTFEFPAETADESAWASSSTTYGKREGLIQFSPDLRLAKREQVRETVLHELLHMPLESMRWRLRKTLPDLVGRAASETLIQSVQQDLEQTVDQLATAFAPSLPLIVWPK